MLSVLSRLVDRHEFTFTAIVPESGPLREELRHLSIPAIGFDVRNACGTKRPIADLASELNSTVTRLKPDILHANSLSMSRLLGRTIDSLSGGVRWTGHIRDIMKISRRATADLNRLDRLAAVSHAVQSHYADLGVLTDRCSVIYNGVDCERFRKRSRASARTHVLAELPAGARVILNVGQICLRKGQLDLAQSLVELLRDRDDLHLVLAGTRHSTKPESLDYEQAIEETFLEAGRRHHLHRLGYRTDVASLMNAADLLVHSAHQEPLGRVLLEAAASELPIIATDVGGTREILRHDHDAILVPPGDPGATASVMTSVLDDTAAGKRRAASARDAVMARFDLDSAADALAAFWSE